MRAGAFAAECGDRSSSDREARTVIRAAAATPKTTYDGSVSSPTSRARSRPARDCSVYTVETPHGWRLKQICPAPFHSARPTTRLDGVRPVACGVASDRPTYGIIINGRSAWSKEGVETVRRPSSGRGSNMQSAGTDGSQSVFGGKMNFRWFKLVEFSTTL